MTTVQPTIVVHGGAGAIPDDLVNAFTRGCRYAAELGMDILSAGGSAEDAVEAAVRYMEDDDAFDAGRGSFLNMDGVVEMDAAFMEGAGLNVGAVAGVRDIANPITLARRVMDSEHVFIIGEGASRFAVAQGMARCAAERLVVEREIRTWEQYRQSNEKASYWAVSDTVGAVALDAGGHLAAGVSTGGRPFKLPGRVGDVPCPGCGYYADDAVGAAVSTGEGEAILRVVMARGAIERMAAGCAPQEAAEGCIADLARRTGSQAGIIVLDPRGRVGMAFNTLRMGRAWSADDGAIRAAVNPGE
jgi:beta-aspartyl-peptidase (threonine type)